jgi:putative ABC transport system permease protein
MLQQMKTGGQGLPLFGSSLEPEMAYQLQKKLPDGCYACPLSVDIKTVEFGSRSRNVFQFATNENYPHVRGQEVLSGRYFNRSDRGRNVCVLGSYLKEKVFGEIDPVGREVRVDGRRFKVTGVLEPKGMTFVINNDDFLLVPYWVGGHLGGGKTDGFLISTPSPGTMRRVKTVCEKEMKVLVGGESYTVVTEESLLALAGQATRLLQIMSAIVTVVALIVGGVGIMNIMLVAVRERYGEIGIRKAIGASPGDILAQFLVEAVLIGLAGGIIGIALGYAFIKGVELLFDYPAYVSAWSVCVSFLFSLAVGGFFGAWPALKAAKLDPVESLGHQM